MRSRVIHIFTQTGQRNENGGITKLARENLRKTGSRMEEIAALYLAEHGVELVKIARYYQVEEELEASIQASLARSQREGLI